MSHHNTCHLTFFKTLKILGPQYYPTVREKFNRQLLVFSKLPSHPQTKIHGVKVAFDCCQSNMIPAFWVFYSTKLSSDQFNQLLQMSFRSDWIEIKSIHSSIIFVLLRWQSIANFTQWILAVGGCIILKILVTCQLNYCCMKNKYVDLISVGKTPTFYIIWIPPISTASFLDKLLWPTFNSKPNNSKIRPP